jgi:hypothetical protein
MGNIVKDIRVAWWCPEIRWIVLSMYLYKLLHVLTVMLLFPLILVALLFEVLHRILQQAAAIILKPVEIISDVFYKYQRDQINVAHSRMSIEEIQQRLRGKDNS